MRKTRDLVGLPVVDLEQAQHVGEVRDILFSPDGSMHSLLIERAGLMSPSKIIRAENLHAIGEDAITIRTRDEIEDFRDETGIIRSLLGGDVRYVGKDVLTEDGMLLGRVEDVYVDRELHTIVGYEISEGFLVDLREGRKVLTATPDIMLGADAVLVPEGTELTEDL